MSILQKTLIQKQLDELILSFLTETTGIPTIGVDSSSTIGAGHEFEATRRAFRHFC